MVNASSRSNVKSTKEGNGFKPVPGAHWFYLVHIWAGRDLPSRSYVSAQLHGTHKAAICGEAEGRSVLLRIVSRKWMV